MNLKSTYLFTFFFFLLSCGATVNEIVSKNYTSLPIDAKIAILDLNQKLPENAEKIGEISYGDNGLSVDCDYHSNLSKARKRAREIGANIVKIIDVESPNLLSTCYRMHVSLYKFNGDVSNLPQIQLQQN